jgi:co-chaperonin GroES (HSP10)
MKKTHKALNTNVIVKEISFVEQKSAGGIIVGSETQYEKGRAEGMIEDIGPNAFDDFGTRRPKVGDKVVYARYAGKELGVHVDGLIRRIMCDLDILCLIEETE